MIVLMAVLLVAPIDLDLTVTTVVLGNFEGKLKTLAQQLAIDPIYTMDPNLPGAGYGLVGFYDDLEDSWGVEVTRFNLPIALKAKELRSAYPIADDMLDRIDGIALNANVYPKPSVALAWAAEWFEEQGVPVSEIPLGEWPAIEMKAPKTWFEVGQHIDLFSAVEDPTLEDIERTLIELNALPKP